MSRILEKRYAISRRRLIQSFGALAAMPLLGHEALAQPVFATYPFQLGVAAGDPMPDGFVIWTRLAPQPLEIGYGMPSQPVEVLWEVASDRSFQTIIQKGSAVARPELAHSVHVEVAGLDPATTYWYRFIAGKERSLYGRARTMPAPGASLARVRFASAGPQLAPDIEGLALADGVLYASAQNAAAPRANWYSRYDVASGAYLGSFRISNGTVSDDCDQTDGIEAYAGYLGPRFPNGLFVCQDGFNDTPGTSGTQDFKYTPLDLIEAGP